MVSKFYYITGNIVLFIGIVVAFFCLFLFIGEKIMEIPLAIVAALGIFLYFLFISMIFFAIGSALKYLQRTSENTVSIYYELLGRRDPK